jgi:uncharacterized membrane protein YfcA
MRYRHISVTIFTVVFSLVLVVTTASPVKSDRHSVLTPASIGITQNKPIHRSAPEEKIEKPSKWPWIVLGGLAVGLLAILVGGGGGGSDSLSPSGEGNVSFDWPTAFDEK